MCFVRGAGTTRIGVLPYISRFYLFRATFMLIMHSVPTSDEYILLHYDARIIDLYKAFHHERHRENPSQDQPQPRKTPRRRTRTGDGLTMHARWTGRQKSLRPVRLDETPLLGLRTPAKRRRAGRLSDCEATGEKRRTRRSNHTINRETDDCCVALVSVV